MYNGGALICSFRPLWTFDKELNLQRRLAWPLRKDDTHNLEMVLTFFFWWFGDEWVDGEGGGGVCCVCGNEKTKERAVQILLQCMEGRGRSKCFFLGGGC